MRKYVPIFALLCAWAVQAAPHSATLTWAAPSDATATSAYNVYRATGACPASGTGSLTFAKITTTPISALTYADTTVSVGNTYCYYVTQVQGTQESAASNTVGGPVLPFTVTIQLVIQ